MYSNARVFERHTDEQVEKEITVSMRVDFAIHGQETE
jgi:hypothetical protein